MNRTTGNQLWKCWKLVRQRSWLITLVAIASACGLAHNGIGLKLIVNLLGDPVVAQPNIQQTPVNSPTKSLTLSQLQNATYQVPLLGNVTLVNGTYQSQTQPNVVVTMSKKFAIGNLNQDGTTDAVTVLRVTESGRKPTFYLAAIVSQNGQPNNVDTLSLGQGFGVKSLSLKGQQITVKLLKYRPNDAPCCPSDEVSQSYWFNTSSGELIATSFNIQNPNPDELSVRDVGINTQINQINDLTNSPGANAVEIQF
ncbi:hypothetical protein IQ264_03550 [Phormidium sp. LEGE 05292]|uniref:hypothetical protein n=1 Tax=[Phormidium] sp. LEGE 05292 TaxID=767427 RepID=UPI0018824E1C|nr:hypothetical protein [Phormidium sp. LEGE 05292]MBE9224547.1 hypothetical protein [Phormidium sp. LEGE 05292]